MKRSSAALALASGLGLLLVPALTVASGMGGGGGGGMPSGSTMSEGRGAMGAPEFDPSAEFARGESLLQAGKFKDAAQAFQHVVEAAPRSADAWLLLGMSKSGAGDDKGAEAAYQRSLKIDGSSVRAHRELAMSLIKLKQIDKANAELATLQKMSDACAGSCPDAPDLKAAIAAVQGALTAQPPAAANAAPEHLSLATPEIGDGAYVRAVSLINERRWDEALASLRTAELAFGPHPDILTYEGFVWRHKGDWGKAEGFYQAALALDPAHRGATEYYGELKVLKGDVAGAKAMLARLDAACTYGCAEAEELRRWIDHGGDPAA
jgi:tetratricopeptide (TPR) repeat protein